MNNNPINNDHPTIPASQTLPELTFKAILLAIILTIVLGAANAYLGLKVGMTVSASIPAAIIAMGILRFFRNSNILENNIVQTAASAGEALAGGIAYTMPALLILHVWYRFDYLNTAAIAMIGGILGVFFSIPLRRALLADPNLRFPEGTAIGNVLRISASMKNQELGFLQLSLGGILGALISFCQSGLQVLADSMSKWVIYGNTVMGGSINFAPALLAAGFIVGIEVAISELIGTILGWFAGVPILSAVVGFTHTATPATIANELWDQYSRYIGIGVMFVGGVWTILALARPILKGIQTSIDSMKKVRQFGKQEIIRTEFDIPITQAFWLSLLLVIPLMLLIYHFCQDFIPGFSFSLRISISLAAMILTLVIGFLCAAICAFLAGLVGSSTSPISGMTLIAVILASFLLLTILSGTHAFSVPSQKLGAAAVAVIVCALVAGISAISNDTMQDLKAGHMVGATPWKQQVMLIIGVIVAALVIPLILQLLFDAYGMGGVFPRPGMDPAQALAAPQASLITAVVQGVFNHNLAWNMLAIGALIAVACILADTVLKRFKLRLHVLAVGLGIYLPLAASTPIIVGGFISYLANRKIKKLRHSTTENSIKNTEQQALLLACGLVAGAALMGVLLAIPFAIKGSANALRLINPLYHSFDNTAGLIVTIMLCYWLYWVATRIKQNM